MDIATSSEPFGVRPEISRKLEELAEIIEIGIESETLENPCGCRFIRMMGYREEGPNRITITIKVE